MKGGRGTHTKGVAQYSLNMVTTTSSTTLALFRSVAVHSMKMLRVSRVILLCSPETDHNTADSAVITTAGLCAVSVCVCVDVCVLFVCVCVCVCV